MLARGSATRLRAAVRIAISLAVVLAMPQLPARASVGLSDRGSQAGLNAEVSTCLAGQYDPLGGSACVDADPGYYVPADQAVAEVPADPGYYVPAAQAVAEVPADPGNFAPGSASVLELPCAAGTYQPDPAQDHCLTADPGNYVPTGGSTGQLGCAPGTYAPTAGQAGCNTADAGHYVPGEEALNQISCAPGAYQPNTGRSACIPAAAGHYVPGTGAVGVIACVVGTYQPSTGRRACIPAAAGHYVPGTGAVSVIACAAGTYQPDTGKAACIPASMGHYVPGIAAVTEIACAAGTYQPNTGRSACIRASAGNYVPGAGSGSLTPCAAGTYQPGTGTTACILAPVGHYVPGISAISVIRCAAGSYQPNTGRSACILASIGHFVPGTGASSQLMCPNFQTTSAIGAIACRVMSTTERFGALTAYVTGKGPGGKLRQLVVAARTAFIANDIAGARRDLEQAKSTARSESGHSLTSGEANKIVKDANAVLVWRIPILGYHWTVCPSSAVPKASRYLYVCPATFRAELQLLLDHGWTFITAAEFATAFKAGIRPPPRTAVITIDGTEAGDHDVAFPILAALGIHATFFVSPGLLGRPGNQTWATVKEEAAAGQDVENHGMFHRTMTNLHGKALAAEVRDASDALQAHLGYRPSVFCYPNGAFDSEVAAAVQRTPGMQMGVSTHAEPAEDPVLPMEMQRLSVRGEYTPAQLLAKVMPYISG